MIRRDIKRSAGAGQPVWAGLVAVLSSLALAAVAGEPAVLDSPAGVLEVRIIGLESDSARIAVALFASAEDYESQANAVRRAWLEVTDGEGRWRVPDLPEGEYALIAYQDLNGNEEIDMRIFGMPKEPAGVSNNARGVFGPPRFRAASFEFLAPLMRHEVELR